MNQPTQPPAKPGAARVETQRARAGAPAAGGGAGAAGRPAVEDERAPRGALLVEVAWEVCNQLGGIYQVLRSKAPSMVGRWKNRYVMIGPYVAQKAAVEFEAREPAPWLAGALARLAAEGLVVHHGRWLIAGRPKVLLIEHEVGAVRLGELKHRVWEHHGIEFPAKDAIVDGVVSFADATKRLLLAVNDAWVGAGAGGGVGEGDDEEAAESAPGTGTGSDGPSRRVLAHFHEWMGGLAIPMIRREQAVARGTGGAGREEGEAGRPIGIVFTTHATQLGRAIAYGDEWFYDHLPFLDQAAEAVRYGLKTQHAVERACAWGSHCFTTVSPITGEECTHLLGRSPDLILPNGLNIEQYNVGHDFQTFHAQFKERINRFVMGHFFPSYSFDLDKTLYFFTSGRFEPRNKGFDLCLEAMARLNAELKAARLGVTVVFFVVTQRATRSLDPRVLHSRGVLNELEDLTRRITDDVGAGLFRRAAAGEKPKLDDLVEDYWRLRLRRIQAAMKTERMPQVVTHLLEDEAHDGVLNQIRALWLGNRPEDPVKIVYHPEFISPVNPLWGIEYEQFVRGCHMGIFPSAYEPWGYTPLECVAMGVPAVTSDLAGFGRYVQDTHPEIASPVARGGGIAGGVGGVGGMTILQRRGRTFNEAAADLSRHLLEFCKLDRRGRIALRNEVERRSWDFDWANLGRAYGWAHDLAMVRGGSGA